jgi:catechol 2,3-dioxygenase-like lactoylglutathione lyase family enzyme
MAGPLRMVTLVTADLDACRRFYVGVLEMRELGTVGTAEELDALFALQTELWGLPAGLRWRIAHFTSAGLSGVPVLRVLEFDRPGPLIRPGFDVRLEGGVAVGFAIRDLALAERVATDKGFEVAAHATSVPVHRSDGTSHLVTESVFRAPDEVYAFGIARDAPLPPVGPIAPGFNVGGPSYSSVVAGDSQAVVDFLAGVLDFQVVHDYVMQGDEPEDVLNLPASSRMRFVQLYARGASSGYLVVVEFPDDGRPNPVPLGPPSRGVTMWSFRVRDLDVALERVRAFTARGAAAGATAVIAGPLQVPMPFGVQRVASVRLPNGFMIELMEG